MFIVGTLSLPMINILRQAGSSNSPNLMADIRVVVQVNALERIIIVDGKTEFIDEEYWNANIQNILFPFWTSDLDRLIHLNYFSDGSYGICLLYTSPSPRDKRQSRMPSSA